MNFSHKQSNNEGEVSVGESQQPLQLFISAPLCITLLMRHHIWSHPNKYWQYILFPFEIMEDKDGNFCSTVTIRLRLIHFSTCVSRRHHSFSLTFILIHNRLWLLWFRTIVSCWWLGFKDLLTHVLNKYLVTVKMNETFKNSSILLKVRCWPCM